jgi:tetratricopeptide (TPR) repeat protein
MWPSFANDIIDTSYHLHLPRVASPQPERDVHGTAWIRCTAALSVILLASSLLLTGCSGAPARQQETPAQAVSGSTTRVSSKDVEPAFQAAIQSMQAEDWQSAVTQLEALTAQNPELAGAWANLGIAHVQLGNATAAESDFRHAVVINPKLAEAWNQLGMLYRRANRLEEANNAWQQALAADPDHVDANWNLAILYDRYLTDPAQALAHYTRYQQLTQSSDPQLQKWISALQDQLQAPEKMTAGAVK